MQETRRFLHGRLVDAIEAAYAGRLEEHLEELGRHALRAERWDKALSYNREAAKKAHERSAYVAAIERFEDALLALDRLPDDQAHITDKMDVRLEMRTALWPLGRHDELAKRVREAGVLAEQVGDIARLASVHNYLTAHYWRAGEHDQAIEHGEKGIALAERAGDFSVRVTTMHHLGHALMARGEFTREVEIHRKVVKELTGPVAYQHHGMSGFPSAITRGFLAWGLAELGEFDEALRWAQEGTQIASEVNSAMTTVWVTNYLAFTYLLRGDLSRALSLMEPNFALCQQAAIRLLLTLTSGVLGLAYSAAGRDSDAIPMLELAVKPEILGHHPQGSGYPLVWLADGYLHASRYTEAREAVSQAIDIALRQKERGHEAWARYTQAGIERAADSSLDTISAAYGGALEIAERCGMRPLGALCRFRLGATKLAFGQTQNGRALLDEARAAFHTMGMVRWSKQADSLLKAQS
jgi:tetratricopeptide (TPR) repeat protein